MYIADGGRDVPDHEHPRTHQQRLFDAAYELIMSEPAAGTITKDTDEATGDNTHAGQAASGGPVPKTTATPPKAPTPRTMLHVTLTVDDEAEQQIRAACPNGKGYLPDTVLERYACGSMLGGTVFNQRGEVLWHGRGRRLASPAQWAALIIRDGGCVLCGADPSRCQAHHLKPFEAPVEGETNIDELALVCTSCHHWLHDDKHTLYYLVAERFDEAARGSPPKGEPGPPPPKRSPPCENPNPRSARLRDLSGAGPNTSRGGDTLFVRDSRTGSPA